MMLLTNFKYNIRGEVGIGFRVEVGVALIKSSKIIY